MSKCLPSLVIQEPDFEFVDGVFKGKRKISQIWRHRESGRLFYLLYLSQRNIFRCSEPNISEAIRKGVACWQFLNEVILSMRVKKIDVIAISVRETQDMHFITWQDAMKRPDFRLKGLSDEAIATKRFIPLSRFTVLPGKVDKL